MEYYSAITKDKFLIFTSKWMEWVGIMLNKISQSEKGKYLMVSFICGIQETAQMLIVEGGGGNGMEKKSIEGIKP